jgi:hypothetical protein
MTVRTPTGFVTPRIHPFNIVMAGLVPAIHVFATNQFVDARHFGRA